MSDTVSTWMCRKCGAKWKASPPTKCPTCSPATEPTGYSATYRTEDGKTKLKPEVVTALDVWGWREPTWPTRNNSEVWAFVSGWEAAMRHNSDLSNERKAK